MAEQRNPRCPGASAGKQEGDSVLKAEEGVEEARPLWQVAAKEEALEEISPTLYLLHSEVWCRFPELKGVLLHPRIRGYECKELAPPGWDTAEVRKHLKGLTENPKWVGVPGVLIQIWHRS